MLARKRLGIMAGAGRALAAVEPPATYRGALRWNPEMPVGLRRSRTRDAVAGPVTHIEGFRGALPLASRQPVLGWPTGVI